MIGPNGRRGEDTTFGWLPGLVLSVMIAIVCLALIVAIVLYFKGPGYAGQENEFKNFVGFLRTFDKGNMDEISVYLFIAKQHLIVGFDGKDRLIYVQQPQLGNLPEPSVLRSPCGKGKCLCLYRFTLSEKQPEPRYTKIRCEDVPHVPYIILTYKVFAQSNLGWDATITPGSFATSDPARGVFAGRFVPFLAGAQTDHDLLVPGQRFILRKETEGVITAMTEMTLQDPRFVRCESTPPKEGSRTRTQEEIKLDKERCLGQFASKIYSDGRCQRVLPNGLPYPQNDESVPAGDKKPVFCIFNPMARDYSFSTKMSDGTAAEAPTVKMLNDRHADLTFQFHRTDRVPADAVCSVTLRFGEGATERSYPFVQDVSCGSCAHVGAPHNYCYLMPLEATIEGKEERRPASVLSILKKLDPQQQDVLLNSVMQAWAKNQQFGFDVDFEAHSPGDSSWSYAETQRIEYRPAQP